MRQTAFSVQRHDAVKQRGTNHSWSNRSDKPCRMLYVLIDGEFDPGLAASFPTDSGHQGSSD